MDLNPTPEQLAMAEVVRDLVTDWLARPPTHERRWAAVTEIGLDVARTAERDGGLGLGSSDLLPALRALGPVAGDWPWAATLVAGPAVARALAVPADGAPIGVALVPSRGPARVRHADRVRTVALLAAGSAALLPAAEFRPAAAGDLLDEPVWADAPDDAADRLRPANTTGTALAAGRVAEAAVLLGAADHALRLAVEHAGLRHQFGAPIGSFQAVKHLLAEARTELAFAEPLVVGAAIAVDHRTGAFGRDAALALLAAARAARQAARTAVQVHGAMGYTDELPLGRLLAAATHGPQRWGGESGLLAEVAAALVTAAPNICDAEPTAAVPVLTGAPAREEER